MAKRNAKTYLPYNDRSAQRPLPFLMPYPQQLRLRKGTVQLLDRRVGLRGDACEFLKEDLRSSLSETANVAALGKGGADYVIGVNTADQGLPPEGYTLEITNSGTTITGQDEAGLWYGVQTLLQLAAFGQGSLPLVKIRDWPALAVRSVMLDLGRSIYSKRLIQRTIRIMARLKLNALHLHLYDDELMGVRFKHLPLGRENPGALSLTDLAEIVRYARKYHVSVCPELESWGHVASIIYHYPQLYGAPGMYGGKSFAIGPKMLALLERVYDEVIPALENRSMVHLGLDEAHWKLEAGIREDAGWSPETLVARLHDLLMKVGRRHGKKLTMRVWADHGGRPIPARIRQNVIVEPWQYYESGAKDIARKVRRFAGAGKGPFMMGAGSSNMHSGNFGSTRLWCQAGVRSANCRGVTICTWETNQIDRQLLAIYGGADCAWNPRKAERPDGADVHREYLTGRTNWRMTCWQSLFPDANPDAILRDRGAGVIRGYYISGPKVGRPVAPTVLVRSTQG